MFAPAPPAGVFVYLTFFYMNKLIICGKANMRKTAAEIREKNSDLWMLGTDPREGADKYFELHGIKVNHENTVYSSSTLAMKNCSNKISFPPLFF